MNDVSKLHKLKQKLEKSPDLSEAWNYFFDHFGENSAFIGLGGLAANTMMLETVIAKIGQEVFQHDVALSHILLTELPDEQFIHGACFINGHNANVLYFRDIDMGALAMNIHDSEVVFARFTCIPIKDGLPIVITAPGSDILH